MGTRAGEQPLNGRWAARLPLAERRQTASLRLEPEVLAAIHGDAFWLCGSNADAVLWRRLLAMADAELFELGNDGRCRRPGTLVPIAELPPVAFVPLRDLSVVTAPVPALPGVAPTAVSLRLLRAADGVGVVGEASLATDLPTLAAWVEHAAEVRMQGLRFAVAGDRRTLVVGSPLPPIAGSERVVVDGLVLPIGMAFEPSCPAALVRAQLGLAAGELAWFELGGACVRIAADRLVALSRSAVRGTLAEVAR